MPGVNWFLVIISLAIFLLNDNLFKHKPLVNFFIKGLNGTEIIHAKTKSQKPANEGMQFEC